MLVKLFDKITQLSLRFRWIVIALALLVIGLGIWALLGLNLELLPRIEFPQTVVVAQWPDAESSDQFLEEVTLPLEEALASVEGVVNIESTTSNSFAFIIARNEFGLDQDKVVEGIEDAVGRLSLPAGVEQPEVLAFSLSDLPVVVASASSAQLSLSDLKELVTTDLQPRLEKIDEINQVSIGGGQELPTEPEIEESPVIEESEPETEIDDPGRLPSVLVEGARSAGIELEYAQEITPEFLVSLGLSAAPDQVIAMMALIPPEILQFVPPETLSLLPTEFMSTLDPALQEELDELASEFGGINQYTAAEAIAMLTGEEQAAEDEVADPQSEESSQGDEGDIVLLEVEPIPLPDSWVEAAAGFGLTVETTADISAEILGGTAGSFPQLLSDLTPAMWRAIAPEAVFPLIPNLEPLLDPELFQQLQAIQAAHQGVLPEPKPLPESWIEIAAANGFTLETTEDIPVDIAPLLISGAPELLVDLTPETLLAFSPDILSALPEEFVSTLDENLQDTLLVISIHHQNLMNEASPGEAPGEEPSEEADPARLPDVLIEGLQSFGMDIELASDIPPDFMRQVAAIGPQAVQVLSMFTPDNLRALQPEAIALLPSEFLAEIDPELLAELDELAAEFGGAGQLAEQEAEQAEEVEDVSPPLSGLWLEPGQNGEPSQFQTAADILSNPFIPGAAGFLNFLPTSPQVQDPAGMMSALTIDVIAYLAENEEDFASSLSPTILELMSAEVITFLLENYPEAFDADLTQRLEAIAAGELEAFIPESTITRTDGNPSLVLNLFKDGDANTVEVAHRVFDELAAYESENPEVAFSFVFEQASFIEESIGTVAREGLLGAFFAMVIILIFLVGRVGGKCKLSWRSTLVVGVSIPLSVFAAIIIMRWMPSTLGVWVNNLAAESGNGILTFIARLFPRTVTLNIMTLSGMTVAIGRVVDDSIVVLENSFRFIQKGGDRRTAVLNGTREVAIAIFASTATTVAVFLPLGLLGGIIGSFFLPFGMTVTYALAASFVVAITVVPALTFTLISVEHIPEEKETRMQKTYTPPLEWVLRHRGVTMAIASVLFLGSLYLMSTLPQSFIPGFGEPTVNVGVTLPNGAQMADTDALVREFEEAMGELEGIERLQTETGSGGGFESFFGGGGINQGQANLTISVEDQEMLGEVTNLVREEAESIFGEGNATVSAASQTGFSGFALIVTGDSLDVLIPLVDDVKEALGSVDIDDDGIPDIVNVSSNVDQAALPGDSTIIRVDGRPAISFSGELETDNTLGVTNLAKQAVSELPNLPAGVEVTEGFESEQQTQGFRQMITAIGYSIVIVYIIMALTFKSLIHPFTILFSLPFAVVGASLALYISGSVLGISSMIGLMMLVGIVVTNAIVLLELVQQLRKRGESAHDALVLGGRTRLRPIWMTALAAALALTPLALSDESGAIIASELAITVIGGLLVSTFLTLLVVPVVYSLFSDLGGKFRRRNRLETE